MARARRATQAVQGAAARQNGAAPIPAAASIMEPPAPGAPSDEVADLLEEVGEEGSRQPEARISRKNEMGIFAHLDTIAADGVDEKFIRMYYGGGTYRVQFFGMRQGGSWGYLKGEGKMYTIDNSIPFKGSILERATVTAPVQNADGSLAGHSNIDKLMDMGLLQMFKDMQANSENMARQSRENSTIAAQQARDHSTAMMAMLERIAAPRDNGFVTLLPLLAPFLTPIISGIVNRKDPMELARQMVELMQKDAPATGGMKETIGAIRELLEVKDMLGGDKSDNPESMWITMLKEVVPGALELLKTEAAKTGRPMAEIARPTNVPRLSVPIPTTAPAPGNASPSSAIPSAASSGEAPMPEPIQDEWTGLEPHIGRLATFAAQNKDPHGVMKTVMTFAPQEMIAGVRELVAKDDALVILTKRFPVLQSHQAWMALLLDEFAYEFFGDVDDDDPADPAEGSSPADPSLPSQ